MNQRHTHISKFLSYVLRHRPDEIGIRLDGQGWIPISDLLAACAASGQPITRDELDYVVSNNSKQRFALSEDGLQIRASQGHSIDIELGYEESQPPAVLYHGTASKNVESIRKEGLKRGARHHVHLSVDSETARMVGTRYGKPVVLTVRAGAMYVVGMAFFASANGVWLTEHVPAAYIEGLGSE